MLLSESAQHPSVVAIAQSAYDRLTAGEAIDSRLLSDLLGEASGTGVLRAIRKKYSPTAYDAILMPIFRELGRQAPIRPSRASRPHLHHEDDPLTAPVWPPDGSGRRRRPAYHPQDDPLLSRGWPAPPRTASRRPVRPEDDPLTAPVWPPR
jgi:hypothetical protein